VPFVGFDFGFSFFGFGFGGVRNSVSTALSNFFQSSDFLGDDGDRPAIHCTPIENRSRPKTHQRISGRGNAPPQR
jgi:hypothetical protein